MDETSRPTRRELLATIATGGVAGLAGCPRAVPDNRLEMTVESAVPEDDSLRMKVAVEHPLETPPTTDTESSVTYTDTRLLLYDYQGANIADVQLGDIPIGTSWRNTVEVDAFPLVVTLDASGVDYGEGTPSNGGLRTELPVFGFQYRPENSESSDGRSFWWRRQQERYVSDDPEPPEKLVTSLRCALQMRILSGENPTPDVSLVPDADAWLSRPLPPPTRRSYQFDVSRATPRSNHSIEETADSYDDAVKEQVESADNIECVPFERATKAIRERIEGVRYDQWIDKKAFYKGLSALSDGEITVPAEFPECHNENVDCFQFPKFSCGDNGLVVDGTRTRCVQFLVTHESGLWSVRGCIERMWANPGESRRLAVCSEERSESFTVEVTSALRKELPSRLAVTLPVEIQEMVPNVESTENAPAKKQATVTREQWVDYLGTLTGTEDPSLPTCRPASVECEVDHDVHCGRGKRLVRFEAELDGEQVRAELVYSWDGQTITEVHTDS